MKPATITATELRLKTRDVVERVKFKGERLVVENFGRPMVVIISFEDYERVKDLLAAGRETDNSLDRRAVDLPLRGGKKRPGRPRGDEA